MDTEPMIIRESFALPYHGGAIWCEHLDGLANRLDIVEEKFLRDMQTILRPSSPARIALGLYGTDIDQRIADLIIAQFTAARSRVQRVAVIGANRAVTRRLQVSLKRECPQFAVHFTDDFEKGKEWLIP